jgi:F-type H+-transporting ATPase subunit b
LEAIGINLGYLIVHGLNFLIMMLILSALAYRPILNALETRRTRIAQGLEDSRVAGEARANAEKDAEKIISDAQVKAGEIVREATERADVAAREVQEAAKTEADRSREAAVAEAQVERDRILSDLRGQVAGLSIAVAQKLIGETLDERRQHTLIDEFFSGVSQGRVAVLEGASLSGQSAEVVSALPLTPQEQERVKSEILAKMGSQATVAFRVDPAILGGLIIRVGDKVMDASVAGQLGQIREAMV